MHTCLWRRRSILQVAHLNPLQECRVASHVSNNLMIQSGWCRYICFKHRCVQARTKTCPRASLRMCNATLAMPSGRECDQIVCVCPLFQAINACDFIMSCRISKFHETTTLAAYRVPSDSNHSHHSPRTCTACIIWNHSLRDDVQLYCYNL